MKERIGNKVRSRPLCVFRLGAAFTIGAPAAPAGRRGARPPAAARTCAAPARPDRRRRATCEFSGRRLVARVGLAARGELADFQRENKRCHGCLLSNKKGTLLSLDEILTTIQEAWKSPAQITSREAERGETMETSSRKSSSYSHDIPSPVLLRRRLSAPETIMRKHTLAQQRSNSQESDTKNFQWETESSATSDPNLSKKRDYNLMRKSTLMRRLWNSNKPLSRSSQDWHKLASGKSTQSLASVHSSPEHVLKRNLSGSDVKLSPTRKISSSSSPRRMSPQHMPFVNNNASPKRKISVYNGKYESSSFRSDSTSTHSVENTVKIAPKPKYKETESETYSTGSTTTKYSYSSFTTCSDNMDSAYSKSSNNNSNEIIKHVVEENENDNKQERSLFVSNKTNDVNSNNATDSPLTDSLQESSTQTPEVTNLNVISNVKLSQSTLDVIFSHVMQDVNNTIPKGNEVTISSATIQNPQEVLGIEQVPSFFLNQNSDARTKSIECSRVDKYIISNIETGSPYREPSENHQVVVPRFSALPRTSSMEVNTSNGDSEEKEESDTLSLVDSLEDFNSPRNAKHFSKNLDIAQLLPESSDKHKVKKSSSFFIPIEISKDREVKAVSELLPNKVLERLVRRQQKRTEKNMQAKFRVVSQTSDSNYISASDHGTNYKCESESDNLNALSNPFSSTSPKKKNKPFLPNINATRKTKLGKLHVKEKEKKTNVEPLGKKRLLSKSKAKKTLHPTYSCNKEYFYETESQKVYHKQEYQDSHRRIEILEIMECIDPSKRQVKEKSKIPVPVTQISSKSKHRPTYLDFDTARVEEPKLDQLIANILIDTLHSTGLDDASTSHDPKALPSNNNSTEQRIGNGKNGNGKYKQKFEVIPEELSMQSSAEELQNNNAPELRKLEEVKVPIKGRTSENINVKSNKSSYQGKAALALVQDENFASIPKGWITFYTLRRDIGTPESTSDEGRLLENFKQKTDAKTIIDSNENAKENFNKVIVAEEATLESEILKVNQDSTIISSSSDDSKLKSNCSGRYNRKYNNGFQKKNKQKPGEHQTNTPGEWSVTISGTNSNGQFAPNVEMRLKFSSNFNSFKENNNQSDSGLGEENEKQDKRTSFPRIDNQIHLSTCRKTKLERSTESYSSLPLICKDSSKNHTRSDSSISLYNNMVPSLIVPRQTKTSTGRYHLSRPRERYSLPEVSSRCNERQYAEIIRKFPQILSVTGRSISPERKSNVASLSEKDF